MATLSCAVVSAEQEFFRGAATFLVATGELGELGIAPGHTPLLTRLNPGKVISTTEDGAQLDIVISGGILEAQPGSVTVLADTAIRADAIDEASVLKAKSEAERLLADRARTVDIATARQQLIHANIHLKAVERWRNYSKR